MKNFILWLMLGSGVGLGVYMQVSSAAETDKEIEVNIPSLKDEVAKEMSGAKEEVSLAESVINAQAEANAAAAADAACLPVKEADLKFLSRLKDRRLDLDHREKELDLRELKLKKLESEVEGKVQRALDQLKKLEGRVDQTAIKYAGREEVLKTLTTTVSKIAVNKAAKVLQNTENELVVKLLMRLSPAQSAAILEKMNPEKAGVILTEIGRNKIPLKPKESANNGMTPEGEALAKAKP